MCSKNFSITNFKNELPGVISADKKSYEFPIIYTLNTKNKKLSWQIVVKISNEQNEFIDIKDEFFNNDTDLDKKLTVYTIVLSKQEDSYKYNKKTPTITTTGKNIGKKNQTNRFTQALRDALSKYNIQKNKQHDDEIIYNVVNNETELNNLLTEIDNITQTNNVVEDEKEDEKDRNDNKRYPPMLMKLMDEKNKINFKDGNVWIQRKLNGVRMVAKLGKNIELYSRNMKTYGGFSKIRNELKEISMKIDRNIYLDGEAYLHGLNLQDISGLARKEEEHPGQTELEYLIFDCFIPEEPDMKYDDRKELLHRIFNDKKYKYIKEVESIKVNSDIEINKNYKKFLDEKYEGAVVRKGWLPYKYSYNGYHSTNLLKMKLTMDAEFEIIGYTEGKNGKAKGAVMFILQTKEGKEFPVTPGITLEERYKIYNEFEKNKAMFESDYKGKYMTILFDEYSKDGIPLRARTDGIVIRDYE